MKAAGGKGRRGARIQYVPDQHTGAGRCRACSGRIVWALTDLGRRMPVDAQAVLTGGVWVLWHDDPSEGDDQRVSSVAAYQGRTGEAYTGPLYTSHYATCPEVERKAPGDGLGRQLELLKGGLS